ncbi:tyrosine-type recombinase/integrase [Bifidobacterium tibiigranuli]|jgi:integrase|uniref:tyrosine-type recombinase/integrase n=1 Tax=Bifidobacterium tibiigranuli TaxID=2172043 RepID=UPI002356F80A|nr:site-specific integrase [Bifidobacterium tibiigranuli]MCH3973572.1 site-specific integrase [Bifidobacterium tibiigranuli]MCI2184913.1 site-specific integrase [Bifidobacterium tibiigranuli]MCI2204862.1 site-specific integrase [Bifidobacterium tibiigranuli]
MNTTRKQNGASRREGWGSLRKLPSGRWQARYPGPDGVMHTARTDDDKPLTFLTKTDARTWLAGVQTKIARDLWEPPATLAARLHAEAEADKARSIGFAEYAERWIEMIRTQPGRGGKRRAAGTVVSYKGKIAGYLVPEFGDTPVRDIDVPRIRQMTERLDAIPSPLNPRSKFNSISQPVLIVLMMILRQAARDGIISAAPDISIPKQATVRHDPDHDPNEDIASPAQVEALYATTPQPYAIMVLLAAWCQLRRGECLGLQRRDIEWHPDGAATLHVRRQLNAHTGDYTDLKSDAGRRSLSIPPLMLDRLREHLQTNVAPEAKAPVIPTNACGTVPLSNTRWGYVWIESRDAVAGLPHRFRFHDLRHTGLTFFAQEGATLAELMRRGGHSDMRVVLRYQHATMTRDRELADRMSQRITAITSSTATAVALGAGEGHDATATDGDV